MKPRRREILAAGAAGLPRLLSAASSRSVVQNEVAEFTLAAARESRDPFNEIELDAVFSGPQGEELRVPAFWAGGQTWKFRFASPVTGVWKYRTAASGTSDSTLVGQTGELRITPYAGDNPLLKHGPIRIRAGGRQFEHADGTPFFFLGYDWWLGLTSRLRFPDEFRTLAEDRKRKGYTVIKLTAGLNTDCSEFDPRNANEGGQPWEPDYARIRPQFFDWADKRIEMLVAMGLSPSVVGSWGFYLKSMGIQRMSKHWRYCVARWGAYPVTWYLAMENDLPFYLNISTETGRADTERAQVEWTEVGRYLKKTDPFCRPISMQSWKSGHSAQRGLRDSGILDFDSLHMGHGDRDSAVRCIHVVRELRDAQPRIPVVPGEVVFEGIGWQNWQNTQRLVFWGSMLTGAAGFCYGANGIWQFNRKEEPFGKSPQGTTWGGDPWDVAMNYAGSAQVGIGKKFLEKYPYWRIEPHPEWITPAKAPDSIDLPPFSAGIPGELRLVYRRNSYRGESVAALEQGVKYRAFWFDPVSGDHYPLGRVEAGADGSWKIPRTPGTWDFVLVLEREA
jgi:hypothetical protein